VIQKYHIYFKPESFHNHLVHEILTLYGLGTTGPLLEERYKKTASELRPLSSVPDDFEELRSPEKFADCLGKEEFYHSFLLFFQAEMEAKGWVNVLNEYVFSKTPAADDLLGRLYDGLSPTLPFQTRN
jgi:hypothetical protein